MTLVQRSNNLNAIRNGKVLEEPQLTQSVFDIDLGVTKHKRNHKLTVFERKLNFNTIRF